MEMALQACETPEEALLELASPHALNAASAFGTLQLCDCAAGELGGTPWLPCAMLIIDGKLLCGFDGALQRFLRIVSEAQGPGQPLRY